MVKHPVRLLLEKKTPPEGGEEAQKPANTVGQITKDPTRKSQGKNSTQGGSRRISASKTSTYQKKK